MFIVFILSVIKKKKSRISCRTFYIQFELFFFFTSNIKILLSPAKVKVIIKICEPTLSHLFNFDGANVVISLNKAKNYQLFFIDLPLINIK